MIIEKYTQVQLVRDFNASDKIETHPLRAQFKVTLRGDVRESISNVIRFGVSKSSQKKTRWQGQVHDIKYASQ